MHDVIEPVRVARERAEQADVWRVWFRRLGMLALLAVVVLALFNVFGQRSTDTAVRTSAADITLHAPSRVRGGLLYQARITIVAHRAIPKASIVLNKGWYDGLTINTNEPQALSESSSPGGGVTLAIGALQAGQTYVHYFQYQVNPTSTGSRRQTLTLDDGRTPVATLSHTLTVMP
jgi:hypothetical protein